MLTQPFTYYIFHKPTGLKYYGVRFGKDCHPDSLWKTYFTSSRLVKSLIKDHGIDSFVVEVRKTFTTVEAAQYWEAKVIRRLRAPQRNDWLNLNYREKFVCPVRTAEHSQKIADSLRGRKRTEEECRNIGNALRGRVLSDEHKQKLSLSLKGRKKSEETKRRMSDSKKSAHENLSERAKQLHSQGRLGLRRARTEEERKKISEGMKRFRNSQRIEI